MTNLVARHGEAAAAEFSRALVSAFGGARLARSPEAAADVLLKAASKLPRLDGIG